MCIQARPRIALKAGLVVKPLGGMDKNHKSEQLLHAAAVSEALCHDMGWQKPPAHLPARMYDTLNLVQGQPHLQDGIQASFRTLRIFRI